MLFLLIYNLLLREAIGVVLFLIHYRDEILFFNIATSPWFTIFGQLIGLLLPLLIWLALKRDKLSNHFPRMKLDSTNIILIIFMSIFLQPAMMFVSGFTSLFFNNTVSEFLGEMTQHPLWLLLLAVAVTPSIVEEILFRGYIQSAYSSDKSRPFRSIALINGLFFAIIHFNLQQFSYAFIMGIIFAYMVYYTRNVWSGILAHFIMNGTQVTMFYLLTRLTNYLPPPETTIATEQPLYPIYIPAEVMVVIVMGFIALIATPCAYVLYLNFRTHNRQRNIEHDMKQALQSKTDFNNNTETTMQPIVILDKFTQESETTETSKPLIINPFTIAVVVLFIGVMILSF